MWVWVRLRGEVRGGKVDESDIVKMVVVVVAVRSVMTLMGNAPAPFQSSPGHSSTQTINAHPG